jgi:hypothetical protein
MLKHFIHAQMETMLFIQGRTLNPHTLGIVTIKLMTQEVNNRLPYITLTFPCAQELKSNIMQYVMQNLNFQVRKI